MAMQGICAVCRNAARVLEHLTKGLSLGESRKSDNARGVVMAVHVERIEQTPLGPVFSVAHYHEQNGDLCCDPDVTVLRAADGEWYPLTFEQAGIVYKRSVDISANGTVHANAREQADLAQFVNVWMRNVREQQRIELT